MKKWFIKTWPYWLFIPVFFFTGIVAWKILNTRFYGGLLRDDSAVTQDRNDVDMSLKNPQDVLMTINNKSILKGDVDFSVNLMLSSFLKAESQKTSDELDPSSEKPFAYLPPFKKATGETLKDQKILWEQAFDELIERTILVQYIRGDKNFNSNDPKRSLSCLEEAETTSQQVEWLKEAQNRTLLETTICEKSLVEQYLEEVVYASVEPTDQDISAYYAANKSQFHRPEMVTIRHILCSNEATAKNVRSHATSQNFASLAKEHSEAPEASNGGALEAFSYNELPEVFNVAFSLSKGQISEVVQSPYGFHIILLEEKQPSQQLSLEKARNLINQQLLAQSKQRAYSQWVELAINFAKIKFSNS